MIFSWRVLVETVVLLLNLILVEGQLMSQWFHSSQWTPSITYNTPVSSVFNSYRAGLVAIPDGYQSGFFIHGGFYPNGTVNTLYSNQIMYFDLITNRWSNTSMLGSTIPSARCYHTVATDDDRTFALLFGGQNLVLPAASRSYMNDTWIFTIGNRTWTRATIVLSTGLTTLPQMSLHTMTYNRRGGFFYVHGGRNAITVFSHLLSFRVTAGTSVVTVTSLAIASSNPATLCGHTSVIHEDTNTGDTYLILYGGSTNIALGSISAEPNMHAYICYSNNVCTWRTYFFATQVGGGPAIISASNYASLYSRVGAQALYNPIARQMLIVGGYSEYFSSYSTTVAVASVTSSEPSSWYINLQGNAVQTATAHHALVSVRWPNTNMMASIRVGGSSLYFKTDAVGGSSVTDMEMTYMYSRDFPLVTFTPVMSLVSMWSVASRTQTATPTSG